MGIALVYVLETQVLLPDLARELTGQAGLVAELTTDQSALWDDPVQAQAFVGHVGPRLTARVMLLDPEGRLLASEDPADAGRLGEPLNLPTLASVLAGETIVYTAYSQHQQAEVADVLVPVLRPGQQVLGVVRLTYHLTSVYQRFLRLRYVIAGVLAAGLLLGAAVGWLLALSLAHPLRQVTQAVGEPLTRGRAAKGDYQTTQVLSAVAQQKDRVEESTMAARPPQLLHDRALSASLPEQGPAEIRLLLRLVNTLVERLHTLEQARRQLLANLVHELGRPLGALHSATQALKGGATEDMALRQELLVGMEEEVGRLQRLVDSLGRLHDQVLGTLELDRQPIALNAWLSHVLTPWQAAAQAKGLRWELTVPSDLPTLEVNPDRLAQVLGNLLSNAIKYTCG